MAADLGKRLRDVRKARKWTLRKAERRSGVPNAHISQIETGTIRRPGVALLVRLSAAYSIPLAELLALAGHADFGKLDEHGRLEDASNHELWHMVLYLPRGREAEVAQWMTACGIEVYRMYQTDAQGKVAR